ncbi:MAG: M15 family metallopeptidase, partial [Bacteroidales bacterium]
KIDPATDDQFVVIEPRYANRSGIYMQQQAYRAFVEMHQAAHKEGINLTILSAMRTFDHQKRIWNNKWNGSTILQGNVRANDITDPVERAREILRFSAMPGTSRHHWGTDVDLNSLQNDYFLAGEGKKIYEWLHRHARRYGFFQPYTAHGEGRAGGYDEEKWHWSYHPLASRYQAAYPELITYNQITGFDGWQTARSLDVISNYVLQVADPL